MTEKMDISVELTQLAEFAGREDWLYQAELRLADEFSVIATAFSEANPKAEVICKNYIGRDSSLRLSARSSILRSIKSIEKSLDKLQGLKATYMISEVFPDYFAPPKPAQTFFQSEILRRNLQSSFASVAIDFDEPIRGIADLCLPMVQGVADGIGEAGFFENCRRQASGFTLK